MKTREAARVGGLGPVGFLLRRYVMDDARSQQSNRFADAGKTCNEDKTAPPPQGPSAMGQFVPNPYSVGLFMESVSPRGWATPSGPHRPRTYPIRLRMKPLR